MGTYNIHAGHCPQGHGASGAVGVLQESVEDRLVKDEVIRLLREQGHTVYDCTCDLAVSASQCLKEIVKKCNQHRVDLDVSIHLNSGRGDLTGDGITAGTETYNFSDKTKAVSDRICLNISVSLGIRNRGTKYNRNLYVLRHTNSPAILVECCFVDDKDDANRWDYRKCAEAIVAGILNAPVQHTPTTVKPVTPKPQPQPKQKIDVDGIWGMATTRATQQLMKRHNSKLIVDGIISNQPNCNMKYLLKASTRSWQFTNNFKKGSPAIRELQKFTGAEPDGLFGYNSVKALQKYLQAGRYYKGDIDGLMGRNTVRGWQQYLNDSL